MAHNSVNVVGKVVMDGKSKDFLFKNRAGLLSEGQVNIQLDTNKPYILDYLEWSCNHINDVRIVIEGKSDEFPDGVAITRIISSNGTQSLSSTRPNNIINQKAGMWDILEFNESTNSYKFRLNLRGLEFSKGLKIYLENTGESPRNGAVLFYGRELI